MLNISCVINGRKVSTNNMANALESAMLAEIIESVRNTVGSISCKEHGESPSITIKGHNLHNLNFEVSGCCENLIEEVKSKFG